MSNLSVRNLLSQQNVKAKFEEILKGICSTSKNIEEIISAGRKTAEERDLKIIGERLKKIYGSLSRGIQSRT